MDAETALKELIRRHREEAIRYYEPLPKLIEAHKSMALIVAVMGGNRSGKSEWLKDEFIIRMTGWVPDSLKGIYPIEKLKNKIDCRLSVVDFGHGWEEILKPKFQKMVPQRCLLNGSWEKSWSKEFRRLRLYNVKQWLAGGELKVWRDISTMQVMSYDQEEKSYKGAALDLAGHDEYPPEWLWKQNLMRLPDRKGQMLLAMTPDDTRGDPSWVFNEVYEKGVPGPNKDPNIDVFTIFTEDNPYLDQETVQKIIANLSEEEREVRLHGAFIHLTGLVYKDFRVTPNAEGVCHVVEPFKIPKNWPRVQIIDPHPRTPWAVIWVAVDEGDDWWVYDYMWEEGRTVEELAHCFKAREEEHVVSPVLRYADPYAGNEDNLEIRNDSIRARLGRLGIRVALSSNDPDTRMFALREALRKSPITGRPRLNVFSNLYEPIYQISHFLWKEWQHNTGGREQRQQRSERNSHFPATFEYLALENPCYMGLQDIGRVIKWTGDSNVARM